MNIFTELHNKIIGIVADVLPGARDTSNVAVELPRDPSHGDLATNAAMVLTKQLGKNPREIAETLKSEIEKIDFVKGVSIAGPGFININLENSKWQELVAAITDAGSKYGNSDIGENKKVNVEFVSVNPTGPMHVGHARGAVYGDALSRLLAKCGYDVTKEYYINDAGGQIDTLAGSVYIRYKEALGHKEEIPEGMYPGDYLIPVGEALKEKYGNKLLEQEDKYEIIKEFSVNAMMELIKSDLKELGVVHDVFSSEKHDVQEKGKIEHSLDFLEKKGLIYKGVLEPPKGKIPEDWEPREQTLFKAAEFGDDVDRPLMKSDGTHTYFAGDIAYHLDKFERGFSDMVLILGADHGGYVKRMKAAVKAMSDDKANIDIKICQLVNLFKNGEPFKMSKRAGTFITVKDVVDEVGKDIIRFVMLSRKNDTVFDFDFDKVKEQSKDNPVFYVQYAHARAHSILRNAEEEKLDSKGADLSKLATEAELTLVKKLATFPKVVESAGLTHEPHRITYYLTELANEFHSFWAKGNDDSSLRFIVEDKEVSKARIKLVKAVITTIAAGFEIMGVAAVKKM